MAWWRLEDENQDIHGMTAKLKLNTTRTTKHIELDTNTGQVRKCALGVFGGDHRQVLRNNNVNSIRTFLQK